MKKFRFKHLFFIIFSFAVTAYLWVSYNQKIESIYFVPVHFSVFPDRPIVTIELENKSYSFLVDIGMSNDLGVQQTVLDQTKDKIFVENGKIMNGKGDVYTIRKFLIPSIKMQNLMSANLVAQEENINVTSHAGLLWTNSTSDQRIEKNLSCIHGKVGRSFFSRWACRFDFPHSSMALAKNIDDLARNYPLQHFIKLPFFLNECGIIVSLQTDIGVRRFLMDTGATASLFRASQVEKQYAEEMYPEQWKFTSSKLQSKEHDFGQWPFWLYEFCDEAQFDGVLGIDFFKSHVVVFDFENKFVYIRSEPRNLKSYCLQWLEWVFTLQQGGTSSKACLCITP